MSEEQTKKLDRAALSSLILSQDVGLLMDRGVSAKFFQGDYAAVAEFILKHFRRYSEVPPASVVRQHFPWFKPLKNPGALEYYTDKLRERELFVRMGEALVNTRDAMEQKSAAAAFSELSAFVQSVNLEFASAQDLGMRRAAEDQVKDYDKRKLGEFDGITTGFEKLDQKILCYENTDLVVIAAPPRSGKTWYLTQKCVNIASKGFKTLVFSKEMKRRTFARRCAATMANLNYRDFRRGLLDDVSEARFRRMARMLDESWNERLIIIGDDGFDGFMFDDYEFTNTLGYVESKILQYKPDIVLIDGFYLLSTGEAGRRMPGWEQMQVLTRNTKRMCNRRMTPVVLTTQMTRDSENTKKHNLSNLAFGSSFGQDADIVQFMMRGTGISAADEAVVTFPKIREDEDCGAMILKFRPGEEIDFTESVSAAEMEMMDELDTD